MKEKVLLIIRGVPGSGKSFLAKNLAGKFNGQIFSADKFHIAIGKYTWHQGLAYHAHYICKQLVYYALQKNKSPIIIDNTNLRPTEAKPYIKMAKEFNYKIKIVEPQTEWRENIKELLNHCVHGLTKEQLEEKMKIYQNISLEEFKKILEI